MYIRPIQTNLFKHFWSSLFSVLHSNKISIKFRSIEIEIRLSFSVSLPPYGFVEATACYTNCQASYVISRVSCRTTLREKGGRGRSFSSSIYRSSIPTSRQQTLLGNNRSLSLSLFPGGRTVFAIFVPRIIRREYETVAGDKDS